MPKNWLLFAFFGPYLMKVSISRELYIILNWLIFKNERKTHLSVGDIYTIYTSKAKGNGLK